MAREFSFIGSGQFPKGRDQVYAIEDEGTFLVGTAEVLITGMFKDEILRYEDLPLTFVGYCPCFRKEAGTYGKDTRGVFRIHQFNKVEQYVISKADHEESVRWHEQLIRNAEELVQALELPYHVVNVCTGDMGDGKVGMYDLECWIPSEGRYRETHSCSYFHDWQARRANIRYRDEDGKLKFVYTLNNTALASPRILLPLFEVHQQPDGSVRIPAAVFTQQGTIERSVLVDMLKTVNLSGRVAPAAHPHTLSVPACSLTKGWPMKNTGTCIPALVFFMGLHRQEQQCCRLPRLCAAE